MEIFDKQDEIDRSQRGRDSTIESHHDSSPTALGDDVTSASGKEEISSENRRLEDRKRAIGDEMRMRMEDRRKEWNIEVDRLRRDFFHQKSVDTSIAPSVLSENLKEEGKTLERVRSPVCDDDNKFVVSFDLSAFLPNEIFVKTEDRKLIVSARHEEKSPDGKRTATKTFNRQIAIPRNVKSESMRCTLTKDGTLQVEANTATRRSSLEASGGPASPKTIHLASIFSQNAKPVEPKVFSISVNVGKDFLPADLAVKTVDQKLIVSARREVERPGNTSVKEFHREFDLPGTIDPTTVTASMTEGGYLLIEAPIPGSPVSSSSSSPSNV